MAWRILGMSLVWLLAQLPLSSPSWSVSSGFRSSMVTLMSSSSSTSSTSPSSLSSSLSRTSVPTSTSYRTPVHVGGDYFDVVADILRRLHVVMDLFSVIAIGYACCGPRVHQLLVCGLQALLDAIRVMYRFMGGALRILMECLVDLALLAVCTFGVGCCGCKRSCRRWILRLRTCVAEPAQELEDSVPQIGSPAGKEEAASSPVQSPCKVLTLTEIQRRRRVRVGGDTEAGGSAASGWQIGTALVLALTIGAALCWRSAMQRPNQRPQNTVHCCGSLQNGTPVWFEGETQPYVNLPDEFLDVCAIPESNVTDVFLDVYDQTKGNLLDGSVDVCVLLESNVTGVFLDDRAIFESNVTDVFSDVCAPTENSALGVFLDVCAISENNVSRAFLDVCGYPMKGHAEADHRAVQDDVWNLFLVVCGEDLAIALVCMCDAEAREFPRPHRLRMRPARWCGCRLRAAKKRHVMVQHNPREYGECLWSSAAFMIKRQCGLTLSPRTLRKMVKKEYQNLQRSTRKDDHELLQEFADRYVCARGIQGCQMDAAAFVQSTAHRWGSTDDILVLSAILRRMNVLFRPCMLDFADNTLVGETLPWADELCLVHARQHFYVARLSVAKARELRELHATADGCACAGAMRGGSRDPRPRPPGPHSSQAETGATSSWTPALPEGMQPVRFGIPHRPRPQPSGRVSGSSATPPPNLACMRTPSVSSAPPQLVSWSHEEMHKVYGTGFKLLQKMGFDRTDSAGMVPLAGIERKKLAGIQDDESKVIKWASLQAMQMRPDVPQGVDGSSKQLAAPSDRASTSLLERNQTGERGTCLTPWCEYQDGPRGYCCSSCSWFHTWTEDGSPIKHGPRCRRIVASAEAIVQPCVCEPVPESDDMTDHDVAPDTQDMEVEQEHRGEDEMDGAEKMRKHTLLILERALLALRQSSGGATQGHFRYSSELKQHLATLVDEVCGGEQQSILDQILRLPAFQLVHACHDKAFGSLVVQLFQTSARAEMGLQQAAEGLMSIHILVFLFLLSWTLFEPTAFQTAMLWVTAQQLAVTLTSTVCVEVEVESILSKVPDELVVCRAQALSWILRSYEQLRDYDLDEDERHYRGCECALRSFSTRVAVVFKAIRGKAPRGVLVGLEAQLSLLWNACFQSVEDSEDGDQVIVELDCAEDPPCQCPILLLHTQQDGDLKNVMEQAQYGLVSLSPDEVPLMSSNLEDRDSLACLRRRALTFPFAIGVSVNKDTRDCTIFTRTHNSTPAVMHRFPKVLGVQGYDDVVAEYAMLESLMEVVDSPPPLSGGNYQHGWADLRDDHCLPGACQAGGGMRAQSTTHSMRAECLLDGSTHTIANPEGLRRRLRLHRAVNDVDPRPRPVPVAWLQPEDQAEFADVVAALEELRRQLWETCDTLRSWKQVAFTPLDGVPCDVVMTGGMRGRTVPEAGTSGSVTRQEHAKAWFRTRDLRGYKLLCEAGVDLLYISFHDNHLIDCLVMLDDAEQNEKGALGSLARVLHAFRRWPVPDKVHAYKLHTGVAVRSVCNVSELGWEYAVPDDYYIFSCDGCSFLFRYTPPLGRDRLWCHLSPISPTLTWESSDSVETLSDDVATVRSDSLLQVCASSSALTILTGGMPETKDSQQRKRARDSGSSNIHIPWPAWGRCFDATDIEVSVTWTDSPTVRIRVPDVDRAGIEALIAQHLAVCIGWLRFEWKDLNIHVSWADASPCWSVEASTRLSKLVQSFQPARATSLQRRTLQKVWTQSFGVRATHRAGITVRTKQHEQQVRQLNVILHAILPGAEYHSMAIVSHNKVDKHIDSVNKPSSTIFLITWATGSLWIGSPSGADFHSLDQQPPQGTWHSLSRSVFAFPATAQHALHINGDRCVKTLVLYTTRREPSLGDSLTLVMLGFPTAGAKEGRAH
eukprot:1916763-Amphidinium_carterae.1